MPQRERALKLANQRRTGKSELHRQMRLGELALSEIMLDPPELLCDVALFEIIRRCRGYGQTKLIEINAAAVKTGINLAMPLGRASQTTRFWLAGKVSSGLPSQRRHRERAVVQAAPVTPDAAMKASLKEELRVARVPTPPLCEGFRRSGLSKAQVARRLGWARPGGQADVSRLTKTLETSYVAYDTAVRLCQAIGMDPHEAGV